MVDRQKTLDDYLKQIGEAQRRQDEVAVISLTDAAKKAMGSKAGVPDKPPTIHTIPRGAQPLAASEIAGAFAKYANAIAATKWWYLGDDPTHLLHPLRDLASIVTGCVFAERAGCPNHDNLWAIAKSGADYLLWAQSQGGIGLFPFPANPNGTDRAFVVAAELLKKGAVVRNGWIVDDLGDGGLQYDNGLCGVAVLELYRTTREEKYLQAAQVAALWAMSQPVVVNWNYNSFSVYLLAEVARETGESKYLDAASKKARLGMYPGQLTTGANAGRWFDPHNAETAYHYILTRGLVSLAAVDPHATDALRLALKAHDAEFTAKSIPDVESAFEALTMLQNYKPGVWPTTSLLAISAYCASIVRRGGLPVAPGAWGRYLAFKSGKLSL